MCGCNECGDPPCNATETTHIQYMECSEHKEEEVENQQ